MDWGGGFNRFHEKRFQDQPVPVLQTNMNDLAAEYLVTSGGACFLPDSLREDLKRDGVTPVRGAPEFVRQLNIAYHSGSPQRELIEEVVTHLSEVSV